MTKPLIYTGGLVVTHFHFCDFIFKMEIGVFPAKGQRMVKWIIHQIVTTQLLPSMLWR